MNDHAKIDITNVEILPPLAPQHEPQHTPAKTIRQHYVLNDARKKVLKTKWFSDGILLNWFGVDAFTRVLPLGIGNVFTAGTGFYLLHHARRAKCSLPTILKCIFLMLIDCITNFVPVFGQIVSACLLRSQAMMANVILEDIDEKLFAVGFYQERKTMGLATDADTEDLSDLLLRGGKSHTQLAIRYATIAVICFGLCLALFIA